MEPLLLLPMPAMEHPQLPLTTATEHLMTTTMMMLPMTRLPRLLPHMVHLLMMLMVLLLQMTLLLPTSPEMPEADSAAAVPETLVVATVPALPPPDAVPPALTAGVHPPPVPPKGLPLVASRQPSSQDVDVAAALSPCLCPIVVLPGPGSSRDSQLPSEAKR
jgi:hypothetical protein